jgi:polyhydroxyalkanoate synthesis regulator phasin
VRQGKVPATTLNAAQMAAAAPAGAVANTIVPQVQQSIAAGNVAVRTAIDTRFGSVDNATAEILKKTDEQTGRIDALTEQIRTLTDAEEKRAKAAERDRLINEARSGVYIAAQIIGLADPEAGRIVGIAGTAAIDASIAVAAIAAHGLTFASGAGLVGAGLQLASLFKGPGGDPAAAQHRQIMKMLEQIGRKLEEIQHRLEIIDIKIDAVLREIDAVRRGQIEQTTALIDAMEQMERRLTGVGGRSRLDVMQQYENAHLTQRRLCEAQFRDGAPQIKRESAPLARALSECLQRYIAYGQIDGRAAAFTFADFRWGDDNPDALEARDWPLNYYGILPAVIQELASTAGTPFPLAQATQQTSHPNVVAQAIDALIALRLRQGRLPMANEEQELRSLQEHLLRYRRWSDDAWQRSKAADGGGLAAYERAKADALAIVRDLERDYLGQGEAEPLLATMRTYCRFALRSTDAAALDACARERPLLTDDLDTKTATDALKYALYHGRPQFEFKYDFPALRVDYGCVDDPWDCRYMGHVIAEDTYCIQYRPTWTVTTATGKREEISLKPLQKCGTAGAVGGRADELVQYVRNQLVALANQSLPAPEDWQVADNSPLSDAAKMRALAEEVVKDHRVRLASTLVDRLDKKQVPGLEGALERVYRVGTAWKIYDQLALGGCYDPSSSNYAHSWAAGALPTRASVRHALTYGFLRRFAVHLSPFSEEFRAKLPRLAVAENALCSREPAVLTGAINDVDRFIALRKAIR